MKTGWILSAVLFLCGCASYQVSRVPQPQGTHIPAIYAAGQISHAATRSQTLREIAYRKDLTEAELLYMIDLIAIRKGTSEQLKDVLLTILNNPAATYPAKQRVSGVLPNLGMMPLDQKEIVNALAPRDTKTKEAALPQEPDSAIEDKKENSL